MSCTDCTEAAAKPNWGGYQADCQGCETRALAQAPYFIREQFYAHVLATQGARAMTETKKRVKAEYERIQALKSKP